MDALATTEQATALGYDLGANAAALLDRASARIRRAAGSAITASEATVRYYPVCGRVVLAGAPVTAVTSVSGVDENGDLGVLDGWQWDGIDRIYGLYGEDLVEVVYTVGYDPIPDGIVELVCQVAARMAVPVPDGVGAGLRSRTVGAVSATYSDDVTTAALADLLPVEKQALAAALSRRTVWVVGSR